MIGLYEIDDTYIDYLRAIDNKVLSTKNGNRKETRKYVGIIVHNNKYDYFIPLSSYKPQTHDTMYESKSFKKIGKMAVLRINNMIPVPSSVYHRIDFNTVSDINYRNLLHNEYRIIKTRESEIRLDARITYFTRLSEKNKGKPLYNICCDFNALENALQVWIDTHSSNANDSNDDTCTTTK